MILPAKHSGQRLDDSAGRGEVECGAEWGTEFLVLLVVVGGLGYVGGGVALAVKVKGKPLAMRSHAHWPAWLELHGLMLDGFEFARGGPGKRRGHGNGGGGCTASGEGLLAGSKSGHGSSKANSPPSKSSNKGKGKSKSKSAVQDAAGAGSSAPQPPALAHGSGAARDALPSAQESTSRDTASGDGGRWVHVPT